MKWEDYVCSILKARSLQNVDSSTSCLIAYDNPHSYALKLHVWLSFCYPPLNFTSEFNLEFVDWTYAIYLLFGPCGISISQSTIFIYTSYIVPAYMITKVILILFACEWSVLFKIASYINLVSFFRYLNFAKLFKILFVTTFYKLGFITFFFFQMFKLCISKWDEKIE